MILKIVSGSIFSQSNKFTACKVKHEKEVANSLMAFNLLKIVHPFQEAFKGCVHNIWDSLFCMSKKEHLINPGKCFLYHFESFFRYWNNQILTFQTFKCHACILLNNLGSKRSLGKKFSQFMWYYALNFFIKKFYEKCGLETSSRPFLIFKESSVKRILRKSACWLGQISIALLLHV